MVWSDVWRDAMPASEHGVQRVMQMPLPDGRALDIMLSVPLGDAPAGGWPCLVLLDGERFFVPFAGAAQVLAERPAKTRVEAMILVGIAHRSADGPISKQRTQDFTYDPTQDPADAVADFSGAFTLQSLIFSQILPLIRETVAVNSARTTLFGHSLAGLFVLDTLAKYPDGFARWISISPSLWMHTPNPDIATPSLLVGAGELEWRRDMRSRIESWCAAKPGGQGAHYLCADRADHGSAPFALAPDILRWASFSADTP